MELTTGLIVVGAFIGGYLIGCAQRVITKLKYYREGVQHGAEQTTLMIQQQLNAMGIQAQMGGVEGTPSANDDDTTSKQSFGFDLTNSKNKD